MLKARGGSNQVHPLLLKRPNHISEMNRGGERPLIVEDGCISWLRVSLKEERPIDFMDSPYLRDVLQAGGAGQMDVNA